MIVASQVKSGPPASKTIPIDEQEAHSENQKSAQKVHIKTKRAAPKTAAAYWLNKVHKPGNSPHFNIQIKHRGRRHRFPLETADKSIASERARDRYLHLVAHGWEATLQKFKPRTVRAKKIATIGDWLQAVKSTVGFRASTFTNYANSIRQIASEIAEIGDQPAVDEDGQPKRDRRKRIIYLSRFNAQGGGHGLWLAKVDGLPCCSLS